MIDNMIYIIPIHSYIADIFTSGIWSGLDDLDDDELKELAKDLPQLAIESRSSGTVKNYLTAFNRWKVWASRYDEISVFPAEAKHVALYLTHLTRISVTHTPISLAFYALGWAHRTSGLEDPTSHALVKMVRESAVRNLGKGHNKKLPISASDIKNIVKKFAGDNASLMDLRTVCLCLLCFSGFMRFDEVANLKYCDIDFEESYVRVFIEKSKTDQFRDGSWVYIAKSYSLACPVTVLKRYLTFANFRSGSEKYIFRSVSYFKSLKRHKLRPGNKPITYTCARELILKIFKDIGLESRLFGTHSLRAGGATAAANNQVPDRLFKKHGRWRSERVKDGYVSENLDQLLVVSQNLGL